VKAYWHYKCDHGHAWTVFRDAEADEDPADAVCPSGHEAVTLSKCPLLDVVQVSIRPAAQVIDSVTGRFGHEYEYYLVITDLHESAERMSAHRYTWSRAKELLDHFRNLPAGQAWQELQRLDYS
jgi:hypothetical protein